MMTFTRHMPVDPQRVKLAVVLIHCAVTYTCDKAYPLLRAPAVPAFPLSPWTQSCRGTVVTYNVSIQYCQTCGPDTTALSVNHRH